MSYAKTKERKQTVHARGSIVFLLDEPSTPVEAQYITITYLYKSVGWLVVQLTNWSQYVAFLHLTRILRQSIIKSPHQLIIILSHQIFSLITTNSDWVPMRYCGPHSPSPEEI